MKASTRMTAGGMYDAISTTTDLKTKDVKGMFEAADAREEAEDHHVH